MNTFLKLKEVIQPVEQMQPELLEKGCKMYYKWLKANKCMYNCFVLLLCGDVIMLYV